MNTFLSPLFLSIILATQMLTYAHPHHSFKNVSIDDPYFEEMLRKIQNMNAQDIKDELEKEIDPETHMFKKVAHKENKEFKHVEAHTVCHSILENIISTPEHYNNTLFTRFIIPCLTFYNRSQQALKASTLNDEETQKQIVLIDQYIKNIKEITSLIILNK